jgi:hypothetical protein
MRRGATTEVRSVQPGIRRDPLTGDEIEQFVTSGYLRLGAVIDGAIVDTLRAVIERHRSGAADLLDDSAWEEGEGGVPQEPGRTVSFLFNLWRTEPAFRTVALDPRFGQWTSQVLGARRVRLLEDNALDKEPGAGGELRWHQDYSYWPIAQPNAATIWIALDDVDEHNGAMQIAAGTHLLGERLPVVFGTGATYFRDRRPATVGSIGDPEVMGIPVEAMTMKAGEASMHHALTWHASAPNRSSASRRAGVFRYVSDGTIWLGERRYDFNYSSEEVGLAIGEPLGGPIFPEVSMEDTAMSELEP